MEGLGRARGAGLLGWLGLILASLGALHYAGSAQGPLWGLLAAGAGLLCLAAAAVLGRRELGRFLTSRSARLGLGAGASLVVALAVALLLGALASRHHLRLDYSKDARHTLAPQTAQVLARLQEPVRAYAFWGEGQAGRQGLHDLLDQYAYHNRLFSYQFVDPDREPGLAKRFDVRAYGQIVLAQGERVERAKLPEERELTGALIRLGRQGQKTVYLLAGHGEASPEQAGPQGLSQFQKALEQQNHLVKPLLLASAGQVPADASLVVVAGPQKPLLPAEAVALDQYLRRGGGVLLLLEPQQDSGLGGWLQERGVLLDQDLVLDPSSSLVGASQAWPIVSDFGGHPLTRPLEGLVCYFPLARSLRLARPLPQGLRGVEILPTSDTAWGATDPGGLQAGQAGYRPGLDLKGPLSLGAVLELPAPEAPAGRGETPTGRLTVIGDVDFLRNQHLNQVAHLDLALNLAGHLGEDQEQVAIRPRPEQGQPLLLDSSRIYVVFGLPVVLLPLFFLILGIAVTRGRRRPA